MDTARLSARLDAIEARVAAAELAARTRLDPRESQSPPQTDETNEETNEEHKPAATAAERRAQIVEALKEESLNLALVEEWVHRRSLASMDRVLCETIKAKARRKVVRAQVMDLIKADADQEAWDVLLRIRHDVLTDAVEGKFKRMFNQNA
jgi:hypothetical protein